MVRFSETLAMVSMISLAAMSAAQAAPGQSGAGGSGILCPNIMSASGDTYRGTGCGSNSASPAMDIIGGPGVNSLMENLSSPYQLGGAIPAMPIVSIGAIASGTTQYKGGFPSQLPVRDPLKTSSSPPIGPITDPLKTSNQPPSSNQVNVTYRDHAYSVTPPATAIPITICAADEVKVANSCRKDVSGNGVPMITTPSPTPTPTPTAPQKKVVSTCIVEASADWIVSPFPTVVFNGNAKSGSSADWKILVSSKRYTRYTDGSEEIKPYQTYTYSGRVVTYTGTNGGANTWTVWATKDFKNEIVKDTSESNIIRLFGQTCYDYKYSGPVDAERWPYSPL